MLFCGMENYKIDIFDSVPDPRVSGRCLHKLSDILFIAFCTILSNGEDFMDMVEFGKQRESWLRQIIELPHGIPSHDTFNRVFQIIDPSALQECLAADGSVLLEHVKGQLINLDGKKLRGHSPRSKGAKGLYILNAWAGEQGICLGQEQVDDKSNEIKAIPKILDQVNVSGQIVTIDAMGCQTEIASLIREKKGDYVLAVKENQGGLLEEIEETFEHIPVDQMATEYEKDHGRVESRTCKLINAKDALSSSLLKRWQDLETIIKVEAVRIIAGVKTSSVRYYISSISGQTANFFNAKIRGHWSIENQLHWQLDVTFREDQNRSRTGHAATNLSIMRKMALNRINQMNDKLSKKKRRFRASLNNEYLLQILFD